jgi:hypothetical protein
MTNVKLKINKDIDPYGEEEWDNNDTPPSRLAKLVNNYIAKIYKWKLDTIINQHGDLGDLYRHDVANIINELEV